VDLSFALLTDLRIAEVHERYAGIPGPTDVLSFPLDDGPVFRGEVLLSADTARREAAARGHPPYDEVLLYAVHGVLHLLGHDDHDPADRRRMRRAERRALALLGVPTSFQRRRRRPRR
jgi:probable rRNA maturation factor